MGKQVKIKSGYTSVALPPSGLYDDGETTVLTDAEYASLDTATLGAITVTATVADPVRTNTSPVVRSDLDAYASIVDVTLGKTMHAGESAGARTAALTGHSLMYGQDTTASGTGAAVNNSGMPRSILPTPERFDVMCDYTSAGDVVVVNQAYPGDRSTEAINRWSGGVSGDVEFIWIDTNDGLSSTAGPALSDADSAANLRTLIRRARTRGVDVVVMGGSPGATEIDARKIFASAQTMRTVAERMGARYVDVGELLRALPRSTTLFSSGLHLTKEGYNLVGTRMAALMGPKGTNPPKVAPGTIITPRDRLHTLRGSSAVVARTGAADGTVWQIPASSTVAIPVEVETPCEPLIRCRVSGTTIGFGILGVYPYTAGSGRTARFAQIVASTSIANGNGGFVYLRGAPLTSPGPDAVVLLAHTGSIEVDSIEFIPLRQGRRFTGEANLDSRRSRTLDLAPVGGVSTGRSNTSWGAMSDVTSGVCTTTGSAGTTKVDTRWLFDVALGPNLSGVALSASLYTSPEGSAAWLSMQAYWVMRSGVDLVIRKFDDAGASDTTVTGVFASATGIIRCIIEIYYDPTADSFTIYVDGTSRATVATPTWKFYMAGLIAGTTAGGGFASGTGHVQQKASTLV